MPEVTTSSDGPGNRFADELDRIGELPDDLAAEVRRVVDDLEVGAPLR
jgi:hypothetical protein